MQSQKPLTHSFGLIRPHTNPEQMDFFIERCRIGKNAAVIRLWIKLPVSKHEHPTCATKSANVGKEIQMVQCDLEGLHSSHGKAGHRAMITIRKGTEGRVDVGDQDLGHIILE